MAGWDGAGNWSPTHDFTDDRDIGVKILASRMDQNFADIKAGLENCMTRDGQNAGINNISMGSNRITNLDDGVDAADAVNLSQLQNALSEYTVNLINQIFG